MDLAVRAQLFFGAPAVTSGGGGQSTRLLDLALESLDLLLSLLQIRFEPLQLTLGVLVPLVAASWRSCVIVTTSAACFSLACCLPYALLQQLDVLSHDFS